MAAEEEGVSWWIDGTVESTETDQGLSFNRIDPEQARRLRGKRQEGEGSLKGRVRRDWSSWSKMCCVHLVTQSCPTLCNPLDCSPPGSSVHGDSPGQNSGVGCHFLLQGIVPTQGWNPGLLHCRQILYHLSHQGSPLNKMPDPKTKLLTQVPVLQMTSS